MSRKSKIIFSFKVDSVKVRKRAVKPSRIETPKVQYKRIKRVETENDVI
jgi:hypothetical protein